MRLSTLIIALEAKQPDPAWSTSSGQTGPDGLEGHRRRQKAEMIKLWEREQVLGEPMFILHEACYIPASEFMVKEYVSGAAQQRQDEYMPWAWTA